MKDINLNEVGAIVETIRKAEANGDLEAAANLYKRLLPYVATKVKPIVTVTNHSRPNHN